MAELMAAADLAIGAGGVTTWERCCLGLPAIAWPVAANQRRQLDEAAEHGLLFAPATAPVTCEAVAGWLATLAASPALRRAYSRAGRALVDGRGADRVARLLAALHGGCTGAVRLRAAAPADAAALHAWRNHPAVREMSRDPEPIAWSAHTAWFQGLLADPDRLLLIGEHAGAAVGVVRFDVTAPVAEVSIYRVPGSAVPELGGALLAAAEAWLMAARPDVTRVTADVLAGNRRSRRLFEDAGYRPGSTRYEKPLRG
jgi:RimJ/RimL family protein N-acetyltransferase